MVALTKTVARVRFPWNFGQFLDNLQNHRPKKADSSSWHATVTTDTALNFIYLFFSLRQGRPSLLWRGVTPSLRAGSLAARVKVTTNGISNSLNYCVILKHVRFMVIYECGREPHNKACRAAGWIPTLWSRQSSQVNQVLCVVQENRLAAPYHTELKQAWRRLQHTAIVFIEI